MKIFIIIFVANFLAVLAQASSVGTYTIPVFESELLPYATFPVVVDKKIIGESNRIQINISPPLDLTGVVTYQSSFFELQDASKSVTSFESTGTSRDTMQCSTVNSGKANLCLVQWTGLKGTATEAALRVIIMQKYPTISEYELSARTRVSVMFQSDGIGVLQF